MKHKSMLMMLAAAGLLTLLTTACHDDLDGTDVRTGGKGHGVAVKGIAFFEAAGFEEDTLAEHLPTLESVVDDYVPDMDILTYDTVRVGQSAKARRAGRAGRKPDGLHGNSMEELLSTPSLAAKLQQRKQARARQRRAMAAGEDVKTEPRDVAGHKPLVPVRHKTTAADTRSYDTSDETAIFVMGDTIGVYDVDASGNIVAANVKFYYDAGEWNCETVLTRQEGHHYFAYHPYRTDEQLTEQGMTVDPTAVALVGTAVHDTVIVNKFFKTFWMKWPVSDDQGTFEKYHACDLLGGMAQWNDEKQILGFPMHHLMGMLQMQFGIARYYLDWADEREDHYPYWWTDTVTTTLKDMKLLPKFGGKYRRITRPDTRLSVGAADGSWVLSFTPEKSITRGHYQHYDIGRTTSNQEDFYQIFYNQLGDILLKDGRMVHRHDHLRIAPNDPVGIVVGTVYPSIESRPGSYSIVGPVEDETYNKHSLDRGYLYNMRERSRTVDPETGDTVVIMQAQYIRCLIMSLKNLSYSDGSWVGFPREWGAAWSWDEALSHFPNTHVVGAPSNNVWSTMKTRVVNNWYPDMSSSWSAKAACEDFNNNAGHVNQGVYSKHSRQYTPNSGWFIGTAGQYQMAFCFGRVHIFGDSWDSWDGPDNDGKSPMFIHATVYTHGYVIEGDWYQHQYKCTQRIYNGYQNATEYYNYDYYHRWANNRDYEVVAYWEPYARPDYDPAPTMYHDFARINNAMQYAVYPSTALYETLSGEYVTSTLWCDISEDDRIFPSLNKDWDYDKKYWNYHTWYNLVSVKVNPSGGRGSCFGLDYVESREYYNLRIRPLMAL